MEAAAMPEHCTIYLVRHAEKQQIAGEKDPPLTAQGEQRAQALAQRLRGAAIDRLFATGYRRTQLTLTPLATALGKSIEIYDGRQSAAFLTSALTTGCHGQLIIAGHSNTLPELLRAAGINETAVEFDESRYGELFIIERQRQANGWEAQLRVERFGD
jgi:phosphohistidine phosphatase SixA